MQFGDPEFLTREGLGVAGAFLHDLAVASEAPLLLGQSITTPLADIERLMLVEDTIDVELTGASSHCEFHSLQR